MTVKTKFQIVMPRSIREVARVHTGDLFEAKVEQGKITFSPRSVVDRHLAEGLADLKMGRSHDPCASAKEAIAALESRAVKPKPKRR